MKASRRGILSYFNGSNECICIRDQMQVGSDIKNSTIVENSELVKVLRKKQAPFRNCLCSVMRCATVH